MIISPYNSAILRVSEYANGVDKLQRIEGETKQAYNRRRRAYIERMKRSKRG